MTPIHYKDNLVQVHDDEPVLDALLRAGFEVPHACRSGVCQSCLMQAKEGTPPPSSQRGLKSTQTEQGFFLACQCRPQEPMTIGDAGVDVPARLVGKTLLNERVMQVRIRPEKPFPHRAGQYVHLVKPDGVSRPYSIASLPRNDEGIELHVLRVPNGQMSGWLFDKASGGDSVRLRGPGGHCFYVNDKRQQPLLLAGTGTGLAPLYGIVQDALLAGHQGPIHLLHGALEAKALYLGGDLRVLANRYANLHYTPCVLNGSSPPGGVAGNIEEVVLGLAENFSGWRVYLCGNPDLVQSLRKKIFLKGASNREIYMDAFFPVVG